MSLFSDVGPAVPVLRRSRPVAPVASEFAADVLAGLRTMPRILPPKYFYDEIGSRLFEEITQLPEYYPTRCEIGILREHAAAMAALIPAGAALVEFGSGSSTKIRTLLSALPRLGAYVPVDISGDFLRQEAMRLRRDFPQLEVEPVAADFTQDFVLPRVAAGMPRAGFFPGSTIGNFEPHDAAAFLRHARRILGRGAVLITGVDLVKDERVLHAAYNDRAGVTARFNLNLLTRINRELGGNFDLHAFEHHAFYNRERQRIEMHLTSTRRQTVRVLGHVFRFRAGETIHTENSCKYTVEGFAALAQNAGWAQEQVWTDSAGYFSVQALRAV